MRFAVLYPLIAAFLIVRLILPAFHGKKARAILITSIIPGALFPAVARFIGGSMVAPDLPQAVMVVGGVLQNYTFCLFALVVIREAASIPARILGLPLAALGRLRILSLSIIAVAVFSALYGTWLAAGSLVVREVTIDVKGLDPRLEGTRIVQLSDLHISSAFRGERLARIVRESNALKPDLVAITGDFVDGTVKERRDDLAALKNLKAPYGVWGCEGNHEHYVDYEGWREELPKLGVKMLYNAHETIEVNGAPVVIAGVLDPMGALRFDREKPDAAKALAGAPEAAFRLMLAHQPKLAPRIAERVDLILSGHTHGGQIFLLNPIVSKLNDGFVSGLYVLKDGVKLYVSPGTNVWNGFLLRLGTADEITLITLKAAQKETEEAAGAEADAKSNAKIKAKAGGA